MLTPSHLLVPHQCLALTMFPRWPKSAADLVPLPRCDGPKMKPFDFQGPQKIEFLERLGEGSHSHVVKVKILGDIYALKVVGMTSHHQLCDPLFNI